jgi:hypothetical protein
MSIFTRLANRLLPRRLERDLRDEVEFHIELRSNQHLKRGMSADEATRRAHQQFGDINVVMSQMRQARMSSVTALVTLTSLLVGFALLYVVMQRMDTTDLRIPQPPAAPLVRDIDRPSGSPPPPPPGRGPTWEEYVSQANAFKALQQGPGTYSPRHADK